MSDRDALMVLNGLPQLGPVKFRHLMTAFSDDVVGVLRAKKGELMRVDGVGATVAESIVNWEKHFDLEREKDRLNQFGGEFVTCRDEDYPPHLREIYDPPIGLYMLGGYRPREKSVGIIGSRRCTLYGLSVAKKLATGLVRAGFCVVSGMARGIDSAAHEGAIEGEGPTAAVLGCGPDIVYPPENKDLYQAIQKDGCVISEYMFGRKADKMTFPRRNRIVAGMVQGVVVVETNSNGGSMITARLANESGRQVFVVPGRIDQAASKGCHELIRDGATLVTCVEEVLEDLNYLGQMELGFEERPMPEGLTDAEERVLLHLREAGMRDMEGIADGLEMGVPEVSSTLMLLELKRAIKKRADGSFEAA